MPDMDLAPGLRKVRYAANGDVHLAYDVIGDGDMDLLFVPPWFSNLDLLDDFPPIARAFERIARFARMIRFDRRGSGLSDRTCGHATLEEGVEDILAVLAAAESQTVSLLGMNEGGALCAMFAATFPERVRSLILYGSYATTLWKPDYPWAPRPEEREQEVQLLIHMWGTEDLAAALNPTAALDPTFVMWATRWNRSSVSKDALPRAYELLSKTDVRGVLPSISAPTLVLHRRDDAVVAIDNGRYLASRIPGARLVELEGADHLPFLGDFDSVLDEIEEFLTGERPEPEHERVLATIVFSDIVGSSRRALELGDEKWSRVHAAFETCAREEVERARGRLVKTLGDGVVATFTGPARAIHYAARLRDRARALGLDVRSGVHTGEVEVRRDDVVGIAMHIAARVADLAGPGEVLVSGAVPPLVAGAGIFFEDRGTHELRGITGEWHVLAAATR